MSGAREMDRKLLSEMNMEKIMNLFFTHMRNLWAVDGIYFLGIEKRFGTEAATEIDQEVWEAMGSIEAKRLKKTLEIDGDDVPSMMKALRLSSWSLDLEDKEIVVEKDRAIFRNTNCRVQNTRRKKGLSEFPCKSVRWPYLKNFAREFSEDIEVACNICPPDEHKEDLWCEWEFIKKGKDRVD